ncbi:branched-chain amino acid ABC transporter substrate-binding protein [Phycicoccus sp. CSK15P-2]|uniref:branched-chain amino acid ABC transporter substrate-binding protein n=1 Tax=Phycicoccus sp. CSK15P-2 TaxID=2807627 RepID=UPI00195287B7|nr:branched-chain amino acid ABC transporter substrate-binding protein [Phycicoccus sp. CSK15P-2]MBM6404260.1 branched-chain amino acid ABC transporter substrate-binding protein [Phycicoccus sp. CSK15P-2]
MTTLSAGLVLAGCGTGTDDTVAPAATEVGVCTEQNLAFLGALSGDAGVLGDNMANGVQLAIDEYNETATCKVGLKKFDSQGDPEKAPDLAAQIVFDSTIVGLVGPGFSGESLATGAVLFEAGLPSISPSATNVTITQQGWTTWHRVIGNDFAQGKADAVYLTQMVGAERVYIVDDGQDYSKGLATVVENSVGNAGVGHGEIEPEQKDMSDVVEAVTDAEADAVFYGGYYTEAGRLVKQLREAGWKGAFMSGDGAEDPAFVEIAGEAGEGAVLSAPAAPAPKHFAEKFEQATGIEAGLYTTQAYDAANIFLAALAAGKSEPADINMFIGAYQGDGVSGPISFDAAGDIASSLIYAYHVRDGELDTENPDPIK